MAEPVLIVDRSASTRRSLSRQLERIDCVAIEAEGLTQALEIVEKSAFRVALLDLSSLSDQAPVLMRAIRRNRPTAAVILLAGPEHIPLSIQCMRLGAFDDLPVPLDVDLLVSSVRAALAQRDEAATRPEPPTGTIERGE